MSIHEIENKFQQYVLHGSDDIYQYIINTNKVSAKIRLDVYRNAYHLRLYNALARNYPVLKEYLGWEAFTELSDTYIAAYPSQYRSIRWFGDKLADHLKQHPNYKKFLHLPEFTLLEWTMGLVFDAADSEIFKLEKMANIPHDVWINMRLQPHPSIQRLNFSWNVIQIWQAIIDEQLPPQPQQNSVKIAWILWRKELISQFSHLSEDESWAIDVMLNGATFGEICAGLCRWGDEQNVGLRAASLLKRWIANGLITDISV